MSLGYQIVSFAFRHLFTDANLLPIDMKVYGILWYQPGPSVRATAVRHHIPYSTFRRSVKRLIEHGWAYKVDRAVIPWMPLKIEEMFLGQITNFRDGAHYRGEWLMRCWLDLLVRDADYIDNARPEWLVSGQGSGRLELDRWYVSANVAFEFQGPQHFRVVTPYTDTLTKFHERVELDALKARLCETEGIKLVEIVASDLSFTGMRSKLKEAFPVALVPTDRPLIRYLERQCRSYRNYMAKSERSELEQ